MQNPQHRAGELIPQSAAIDTIQRFTISESHESQSEIDEGRNTGIFQKVWLI